MTDRDQLNVSVVQEDIVDGAAVMDVTVSTPDPEAADTAVDLSAVPDAPEPDPETKPEPAKARKAKAKE